MEIHQLRYFLYVAEATSFTQAAARANISQPSLSQQILNLEKELKHKLFHRLGRKAVLTEAGTALLQRARRIIVEVEDTTRELQDSPNLERKITVGVISTLATHLMPPLIALCKSRLPHLQIHIREDLKSELTKGIQEGEIDLAIVPLPAQDPHISSEKLFKETLYLAIGKPHPLARKPEIKVEDLIDQQWILLGSGSSLAQQIHLFCGAHNFEPKIGFHCSQVATVKALVGLGVGISILPEAMIGLNDRAQIIARPLVGGAPTREIGVIRHQQRYQNLGAEQFMTLLREHIKKAPAP